MKMTKSRAEELLIPLKSGQAVGISPHWRDRLIEALEYVIEQENKRDQFNNDRTNRLDDIPF